MQTLEIDRFPVTFDFVAPFRVLLNLCSSAFSRWVCKLSCSSIIVNWQKSIRRYMPPSSLSSICTCARHVSSLVLAAKIGPPRYYCRISLAALKLLVQSSDTSFPPVWSWRMLKKHPTRPTSKLWNPRSARHAAWTQHQFDRISHNRHLKSSLNFDSIAQSYLATPPCQFVCLINVFFAFCHTLALIVGFTFAFKL